MSSLMVWPQTPFLGGQACRRKHFFFIKQSREMYKYVWLKMYLREKTTLCDGGQSSRLAPRNSLQVLLHKNLMRLRLFMALPDQQMPDAPEGWRPPPPSSSALEEKQLRSTPQVRKVAVCKTRAASRRKLSDA